MRTIKKRHFLWLFFALVLSLLFFSVYSEVKNRTITRFNKQQMILAQQASRGMEAFFARYRGSLGFLSNIPGIRVLDNEGRELMRRFHESNSHVVRAVTRVDARGRILHTVPFNPKAVGKDISYQDHVRTIMETRRPVISDVFTAVQGYKAVAYHVPIKDKELFRGTLAVLVPFETLSQKSLEEIRLQDTGHAWVVSQKGTILFHWHPGSVGRSAFEVFSGEPSLISLLERMSKGGKGTASYSLNPPGTFSKEDRRMHAAYAPIHFENTFWSVVVATPEKEILALIQGFRNRLFAIAGLMLGLGLLCSYFFIRTWAVLHEARRQEGAQKALRESEERYRTIIENMEEGYFEVDLAGRFTFSNRSLSKMTGYSRHELMAMDNRDYTRPEVAEEIYRRFNEIYRTGKPAAMMNYEVIAKSGETRILDISASLARDKDGHPVGFCGLVRDITEQKRVENQLQQAQKMEAVGTLAGGIAHDFNNLLMGIQGRTSLMISHAKPHDPNMEHLRGLEECVKSATDLTRQLLGFARGGKYEVKPADLNMILEDTSRMFWRTRKEINIHKNYQDDILPVEIDRGQIEQVFMNLFVNAWQAMHGGGDLYIETGNVEIDENYVKPFEIPPGNYIKTSITDTGEGMDPAIMDKIFEPFFTTKPVGRGTGLGLASAYGIIKNHGGFINVYSEKGTGSAFNIYLPASHKEISEEVQLPGDVVRGSGTLLLVDDEEMIADVSSNMLRSLGYDVFSAGNGREALELYGKHGGEIDLVILDMVMPGMGGRETLDRLMEINPDVEVLLSSGYSINGRAQEILARGCRGFIQKPFDLRQLSLKIAEIMDKD